MSTGRLDPDAPGAYALTATSPAGSTHWVVRVRGTVQVPEDYDSVQEAVDAAAAGDTVLVGAGVYPGPVRVSRAVRIVGSGAAVTVLDGAAEGSTLLVEAPLLLEALTLRGGQALRGGGLHALAGVDLLQVDLRDNLAVHGGGLALQAGLTGAEVRVLDNRAIQHGGALWAQNTTADLDTVHVAGAVAAVGSLLWARGSQLRFQHLLAVDGVSTGAPMQIEGGLLHVDFATFGHLTGQPGLIQAAGSDVRWSGVYVVGGEAPLFVVSSPPSLSGGAFFDVDPTAESFPIGPLDPGFDFGPLSPDGDWANDVWGRDQNLPEGAFGPALP